MSRFYRCVLLIAVMSSVVVPTALAAKHPSNEQQAIQAVKREIARKYPLLNASSSTVNVDQTHVLVSCEKASKTRFTCEWDASNNLHDRAEGSARVVVYSNGAQATLYDEHCSNAITGVCE